MSLPRSISSLVTPRLKRVVLPVSLLAFGCALAAAPLKNVVPTWWDAAAYDRLPAYSTYENAGGKLGVLNSSGDVLTANHGFLTPIGTNGRACVTCHQPGNAMSVSADSLRERWNAVGVKDPVFAAIDGSNCPSLPQAQRASHSLLIDHGLFRVPRPWPPRDLSGKAIEPEFKVEVVKDPTTCNTNPTYGLNSKTPTISVFRRPRVAANMRFVTSDEIDPTLPSTVIGNKSGMPRARDPESGKYIYLPVLADGAQPSIARQALAAADGHLAIQKKLTTEQQHQINDFMQQVYVAQDFSTRAGDLTGKDAPPGLGTRGFKDSPPMVSGMPANRGVFKSFEIWRNSPSNTPQGRFRASVVRGYDIFWKRPFFISDVAGFTDIGMGNPYKRTCAMCHNTQMSGIDKSPGFMDIGVENLPTADPQPHLPLFKLTCRPSARPHAYLGRTVFTHDPGRALISGKCKDIGSINLQQLRGLSARAPYFASGAAKDLPTVVDYYDRRFKMNLTRTDKADLINFMTVL